jgi:hypothetical protein
MTDCSTVEEALNAALGGAPLGADAEAHLADCAACRALRDDLAAQDRGLRAAFDPLRRHATAAADAAIEAIRREPGGFPHQQKLRFFPHAMAAAAGFLLAVIVFRPWQPVVVEKPVAVNPGQVPVPTKRPMAKLEVATGAIQSSRDGSTWTDVAVGGGCEMDTWVRCAADAKAEFALSDSSVVRLESKSTVFFGKFRKFRLDGGRLYARVAPGLVDFDVVTENGLVAVRGAADRNVPPATIDVARVIEEGKKVLEKATDVVVLEGAATVRSGETSAAVEGPRRVLIVDDRIGTPVPVADGILATRWIHDLLLKRADSPELAARVRGLLANVAKSELELRRMGDACAKPIVTWACGPESKEAGEGDRRRAVEIAADLATKTAIPELISLLEDSDSTIRLTAAKSLERLTGLTQGCGPADWTGADTSKVAAERWKVWAKEGSPERAVK